MKINKKIILTILISITVLSCNKKIDYNTLSIANNYKGKADLFAGLELSAFNPIDSTYLFDFSFISLNGFNAHQKSLNNFTLEFLNSQDTAQLAVEQNFEIELNIDSSELVSEYNNFPYLNYILFYNNNSSDINTEQQIGSFLQYYLDDIKSSETATKCYFAYLNNTSNSTEIDTANIEDYYRYINTENESPVDNYEIYAGIHDIIEAIKVNNFAGSRKFITFFGGSNINSYADSTLLANDSILKKELSDNNIVLNLFLYQYDERLENLCLSTGGIFTYLRYYDNDYNSNIFPGKYGVILQNLNNLLSANFSKINYSVKIKLNDPVQFPLYYLYELKLSINSREFKFPNILSYE